MTDWIDIQSYQNTDDGGRVLSVQIADSVSVAVEASPSHRDIRITADNHIVKIRITQDWRIQDVLIDDRVEWSAERD